MRSRSAAPSTAPGTAQPRHRVPSSHGDVVWGWGAGDRHDPALLQRSSESPVPRAGDIRLSSAPALPAGQARAPCPGGAGGAWPFLPLPGMSPQAARDLWKQLRPRRGRGGVCAGPPPPPSTSGTGSGRSTGPLRAGPRGASPPAGDAAQGTPEAPPSLGNELLGLRGGCRSPGSRL